MGFINSIKKFFNLSLSDPKAWNHSLWNLAGAQSISGETVTEETALTYSAFWNAVNLISGTIASLPLHLMKKQGKNNNLADDIALYTVMHDRWNPFMTAKTGRQVITAHVLTWGNGYAEIIRNGYGEVISLWPISPNRVTNIQMIDNDLVYEIRVDNETVYLPKKRILHLHGLGSDGFAGYSVVGMAMKSIGLSMAMESFGSRFFGAGTHPSAVVSHPGHVKDIKMVRDALSNVYSGLGKSHRLMLLEEGMKFEKIGIPPEEAQFLESRQFQIPEIARWFNLPPHKLKDLSKSSFNNIEQEQISFVTDSILPWLVDFEQEYKLQLLTDSQKNREKLYFKHIVEGLLRADAKSRGDFYQLMVQNGIMTRNEVRSKEDLNPHPDPLADELFIMSNMWPLSQYKEYIKQQNLSGENQDDEIANLVELKSRLISKLVKLKSRL